MPSFDGTGPFGTGPYGRGLGPCGMGLGRRAWSNANLPLGPGYGRGFGRGYGRGMGRGFRFGYDPLAYAAAPDKDEEKKILELELKNMEIARSDIEKRLKELEQ